MQDFIARQNIARFKARLAGELAPQARLRLQRLLDEEEARLREIEGRPDAERTPRVDTERSP